MPKKRTTRPPVGKKDVVKKETKSVQLILTSFPKQSHPHCKFLRVKYFLSNH